MRYGIWRGLPQSVQGVKKWDYGRAVPPRAVFVHIMEGHLSGTDSWFRNPASGVVSTHFGIGHASWIDRALGRVSVYQWVDTANTAYGTAVTRSPVSPLAQQVLWDLIAQRRDVNPAIIHIEVEGFPYKAWPSGFVTALNKLLAAIGATHRSLMVMRHNDVSSKVCPGTAVPWSQIKPTYGQRLGTAVTPPPAPAPTIPRADGAPPTMRFRAGIAQKTLKAGKPVRDGGSIKAKTLATTPREVGVTVVGRLKWRGDGYDPWYIYPYYLSGGHAFCYSPGIDFK